MSMTHAQEDEEVNRLVPANLTMIRAYVRSIILDDYELARDTASDAVAAILQSWQSYDSSRPFGPWARGVAWRVALTALRKKKRRPELCSEAMLEQLALVAEGMGGASQLDDRKEALHCCLERLPAHYAELVRQRFWNHLSYPELSELAGRSVASLHVALHRVYKILNVCVQKRSKRL